MPRKKAAAEEAAVMEEKAVEARETVKAEPAGKPAKKTAAKKAPAKKAAAEKAENAADEAAGKPVKKPAAKKAPAKKAAAEKAEGAVDEAAGKPKKAAAKKPSPRKKTVKAAPAEEAPAVEAAPTENVEDITVEIYEEVPVVEEAPAVEEVPVVEEAPAVEEVPVVVEAPAVEEVPVVEEVPAVEEAPVVEEVPVVEEAPIVEEAPVVEEKVLPQPRRSVAFIGSECYPFVKTGGLGDVMYALPRALAAQNCDVKVILPRYKCIPQQYQDKMVYRGAFRMDLCADGRSYYVGIMEYVWDGVVYDFIDNEEFFSAGNPYLNLIDDIPRYCYFSKAALAALNYMNWVPDIIHCHDWQAALVPIYMRTLFANTPVANAASILTIHNLRFQGVYNIPTIKYWSGLPAYLFNIDVLKQGYEDANMLKGGIAYADMVTTVSGTYAWEIQTPFFGENLDAHIRHHAYKLRGIVNGIDTEQWDAATDARLAANYSIENVIEQKKANKRALQESLGLEVDENKFVIGLISRLTDQKGLDLINWILPQLIDGFTQVVVLGTGDRRYEDSFRYFEYAYKGSVCSNIMYDEGRAHNIYAGSDALLVPSLFEPCGLTQLIAMRYGTVPIVRETGGLKDTVAPYNQYENSGNGFTFDRYEVGLLLDAINRAKTLYFTERGRWDDMVRRDMAKDVSWDASAAQYRGLYLELKP